MTRKEGPSKLHGVRNALSLVFALLIFVLFGSVAFFLLDTSRGAQFERMERSPAAADE